MIYSIQYGIQTFLWLYTIYNIPYTVYEKMIYILAAVAKNGVIGAKNDLPWYLPEDLKRFRELTTGKTVLMGANTYESIVKRLGKPLPNRKNIVVSFDKNYKVAEGVSLYNSLDEAIEKNKHEDLWIIGGASIYKQTMDKADKLYITHIDREVEGDVFFPKISTKEWSLVTEEEHPGYRFAIYEKA